MVENLHFQGLFKHKEGHTVDAILTLIQFKESGNQIIYAPALEVYGYGKTISKARESFKTCLEEFIDYTLAKGTLESELKRLGWEIKGKQKNRKYKVPDFSDFLKDNQRLINILNEKEVRTYKENIPLAVSV